MSADVISVFFIKPQRSHTQISHHNKKSLSLQCTLAYEILRLELCGLCPAPVHARVFAMKITKYTVGFTMTILLTTSMVSATIPVPADVAAAPDDAVVTNTGLATKVLKGRNRRAAS